MKVYGLTEIARALGVDGVLVAKWRERGKLPPAEAELSVGPKSLVTQLAWSAAGRGRRVAEILVLSLAGAWCGAVWCRHSAGRPFRMHRDELPGCTRTVMSAGRPLRSGASACPPKPGEWFGRSRAGGSPGTEVG